MLASTMPSFAIFAEPLMFSVIAYDAYAVVFAIFFIAA